MTNYKNELWKPIPGYEGIYEVSNMGRVRCICNRKYYQYKKGDIVKEGVIKGYPRVELRKNHKPKGYKVHRLVLLAFCGPCPKGKESSHLNDIKTDNRWPENLAWMTHSENVKLGFINGRETNKGKNHPMFGKYHSKEARRKMSLAKIGRNNPMFGRHHSEETKRKMSLSTKNIGHQHEKLS